MFRVRFISVGGVCGAVLSMALPALAENPGFQGDAAAAFEVLSDIQIASVRENVEYCGYIYRSSGGDYRATEPKAGGPDWCEPEFPDERDVVASYHTHAGFDPEAWSEVPSGTDMETDEEEGIDGYVATPGGRFWYIDTQDMVASQLCGIGCLPQDPKFRPAPEDEIQPSYTYDDLVRKIR